MSEDLFAVARLEAWERLAAAGRQKEMERFRVWEALYFPDGPVSTLDFSALLSWCREHHAALCDCLTIARPVKVQVTPSKTVFQGEGPTARLVRWLDLLRAGAGCRVSRFGGWHSIADFRERGPF